MLLSLLTEEPTYQELVTEYLQPEGAGHEASSHPTADGKDGNHNGTMQNGNMVANKKEDWEFYPLFSTAFASGVER